MLGQEDTSYLSPAKLTRLISTAPSAEKAVANVIHAIHGCKEHPENHNIIYTNTRSNIALVKTSRDNNFEYMTMNDVMNYMGPKLLNRLYEEQYFDIPEEIKEKLKEGFEGNGEMKQQTAMLAKTELYNSYKRGDIQKPDMQSISE